MDDEWVVGSAIKLKQMELSSIPPPPPDPPPGQEGASGQHKKIRLQHDRTILSAGQRGANHGYFLESPCGQKCRGCDRGIPSRKRVERRIQDGSIATRTLELMRSIGADVYEWCCVLCAQHSLQLHNLPQLRHGRCCVRGPLTEAGRFPSENCRHLGNLDDPYRVGTAQHHWYRDPSQDTEENVPSASNLDKIIIDEDEQNSAPSPNSPQPLLPPGNFDEGPDDFAKVEQEEIDWPGSDLSPTADWQ